METSSETSTSSTMALKINDFDIDSDGSSLSTDFPGSSPDTIDAGSSVIDNLSASSSGRGHVGELTRRKCNSSTTNSTSNTAMNSTTTTEKRNPTTEKRRRGNLSRKKDFLPCRFVSEVFQYNPQNVYHDGTEGGDEGDDEGERIVDVGEKNSKDSVGEKNDPLNSKDHASLEDHSSLEHHSSLEKKDLEKQTFFWLPINFLRSWKRSS